MEKTALVWKAEYWFINFALDSFILYSCLSFMLQYCNMDARGKSPSINISIELYRRAWMHLCWAVNRRSSNAFNAQTCEQNFTSFSLE